MIELGDGASLRPATGADLEALVQIKRGLPMPQGEHTSEGGFLLGSEAETYAVLLEVARIWLLEVEGRAVGFSVTLGDQVLRQSPIWARRHAIVWAPGFDIEAALRGRITYFDQLGVLPGFRQRYWGAALALRALGEQFEAGHDLALTTTVLEPIVNRAALPYLAYAGARELGRVEERYPGAGRIVSAVHVIEAAAYRERMAALVGSGHPATVIIQAMSGVPAALGAPNHA